MVGYQRAITGDVTQRSLARKQLPPTSFVLVDPSQEQALCEIILTQGSGGHRITLVAWGFWCDRLCENVAVGDAITVTGARKLDEGDHTLHLEPVGAPADAEVKLRRAVRGQVRLIQVSSRGITNTEVQDTQTRIQPPLPLPAAKKQKTRTAEHTYSTIAEISRMQPSLEVSLFAVVLEYALPCPTRGTDMRTSLTLVDETCSSPSDALVVSMFKAHPVPPGVGTVVRFHRLNTSRPFEGLLQAGGVTNRGPHYTSWVFGDYSQGGFSSSNNCVWTEADTRRASSLATWAQSQLSSPTSPFAQFRMVAHRTDAIHQFTNETTLDVVAQVAKHNGTAKSEIDNRALVEKQYGWNGVHTEPIALLRLDACGPSAASGHRAEMLAGRRFPAAPLGLLFNHLQAPTSGFGRQWVRVRNAKLLWQRQAPGAPNLAKLIIDSSASVNRLPDFHAVAAAHTPAPPLQQPRPNQPIATAHPLSQTAPQPAPATHRASATRDPPHPPLPQPRTLPAGTARGDVAPSHHAQPCGPLGGALGLRPLPPGVVPSVEPAGSAAPDLMGELKSHHQPHSRSAAPNGASVKDSQPLTTVSHTHLDLEQVTVKQLQDMHAEAPFARRVLARVVRVLPQQPLLWMAKAQASEGGASAQAGAGADEYQMVLQLADPSDPNAYVGAALLGSEGTTFFQGVPPTDLSKSNVSLLALTKRVRALCDQSAPPVELCVLAYRPDPLDTTATGVAYRIVGTTCHVR